MVPGNDYSKDKSAIEKTLSYLDRDLKSVTARIEAQHDAVVKVREKLIRMEQLAIDVQRDLQAFSKVIDDSNNLDGKAVALIAVAIIEGLVAIALHWA